MAETAQAPVDLRAFEVRANVDISGGATTSYGDGLTFDIAAAQPRPTGTD